MPQLALQQTLPIPFDEADDWISRKPFLKWAGNKTRAKHHIIPHLSSGNRLVEPFAGSCAISLATEYESYLIADANGDLIDMYNFIKRDAAALIDAAEELFSSGNNAAEAFYELRSEFNQSDVSIRKSAIFIYLNRHCFNGLCRYNGKGGFNVPFGKYSGPNCPSDEIRLFADFAQRCEFFHQSFESTFAMLKDGDVVYCDPPYVPLSATSNFTSYAKDGFGPELQIALANAARVAAKKGHKTLISNHDTDWARQIYSSAKRIEKFDVQRLISSKASTRGMAPELLAVYDA
jgi:DNA adenine methylase